MAASEDREDSSVQEQVQERDGEPRALVAGGAIASGQLASGQPAASDPSDLGAARGAVGRRYRTVALIVASVVVAAAVGWFAGARLSTPEQVAADAEPPLPSAVTAAVERRELSESLITRGDARFDDPIEVAFPAGATAGGDIVTEAPVRGASVDDGEMLFELSGAPVLALEGDSPMYRDLGPGDRGRDVMQLEAGLERLGYEPGAVDGVYGATTAAAVRRWHEALGYEAPAPSDAATAEIEGARDALDAAERVLRDAERAVDDALAAPSTLAQFEQQAAVSAARQQVESAVDDAGALVEEAKLDLARETTALETAQMMRRRFGDGQGPPSLRLTVEDLLGKAVLNAAQFPSTEASAQVEGLEWALARVTEAEAAFAVAELDERWDAARIDLADIERRAQVGLDQAESALASAESAGTRAVADARGALALAEFRFVQLKHPVVDDRMRDAVSDAEEALEEAQADVRALVREHDTGVRVAQLVFFDALPVRVSTVTVEDGDAPSGPLMTVSGTQLVIETALPLSFAEVVTPGVRATVDAANLGIEVDGEVSFVADEPGTNGLSAQQVYAEIVPDEQPLGLLDASVRVVIPLASSDGAVLAVPVAALFTAADGGTQVRVERADGTFETIEVAVGLRADGFVEVTPLAGDLTEGDRVVVGTG